MIRSVQRAVSHPNIYIIEYHRALIDEVLPDQLNERKESDCSIVVRFFFLFWNPGKFPLPRKVYKELVKRSFSKNNGCAITREGSEKFRQIKSRRSTTMEKRL